MSTGSRYSHAATEARDALAAAIDRLAAAPQVQPAPKAATSPRPNAPPFDASKGAPRTPTREDAQEALRWLYWERRSDAFTEYTVLDRFIEQAAPQVQPAFEAVPLDASFEDFTEVRPQVQPVGVLTDEVEAPGYSDAAYIADLEYELNRRSLLAELASCGRRCATNGFVPAVDECWCAQVQPVGVLPCGHHESLALRSVESDTVLCELCDCRDRRNDAEQREMELSAEVRELRAALAATQEKP